MFGRIASFQWLVPNISPTKAIKRATSNGNTSRHTSLVLLLFTNVHQAILLLRQLFLTLALFKHLIDRFCEYQ